MVNPGKNSKITAVRLPLNILKEIDTIAGKGNRSKFILSAIEKELKRQKRLAFIQKEEGFITGKLVPDRRPEEGDDTLAFINRLREKDVRADD
ncbi:MAG TPA: hypothetical protein DCE07_08320 [Peptococcaceae bacterium]|nr:hypothetical protein [Peptococcaceae bacterium]